MIFIAIMLRIKWKVPCPLYPGYLNTPGASSLNLVYRSDPTISLVAHKLKSYPKHIIVLFSSTVDCVRVQGLEKQRSTLHIAMTLNWRMLHHCEASLSEQDIVHSPRCTPQQEVVW